MISTTGLSFTYPDGTEAVTNVDLDIQKGEFVALMGANGSGKTTLLKLLIGLLKPCSGEIRLDGRAPRQLKDTDFFKRVGMVFQDPNDQLFASTVEQDVGFGVANLGVKGEEASRRISHALEMVGAGGLGCKPIHTLSYGQKRRVSLAGVLAMEPGLVLLDEPTSGLDPRSITPIMLLLRRLNRDKGIAMVMATHDVELVPLFCDRIIVMHQGRIAAQGTPHEIFANPALTRGVGLRLPRLAHLAEILKKEDGLEINLPLTISEARREFVRLNGGREPVKVARRRWENR
ncbi:MAG: ATP-binding cassette domain-containing protein [Dehalococcoidales bacterium]|nr:ATP-binding cassette domain-containing protein [Dehalococcoidales bacterium]